MDTSHAALREFIELFVEPQRKARYLALWDKPKRRAQLLDELLHDGRDLRPDRLQRIDPPLRDPSLLAERCRQMGAHDHCHVFGRSDLDGRQSSLMDALAAPGRRLETLYFWRQAQVALVEEHDGHQFFLGLPRKG